MKSIRIISEKKLTDKHKRGIKRLQKECFSHVDPKECKECFYAKSFARIIAYSNNKIISYLNLFKRNIKFEGKKVLLGGIGGVCVTEKMRRKGIATEMIKKGLEILRANRCDVACLNADLERGVFPLYEKEGFRLMDRRISFEDIHGKIRYDTGTVFIPICSKKVYDKIMNSNTTFHYGKGYW